MKAFTNTIHTKESAVALAQKHFDHDNYIQKTFQEGNKGCSVGCMVMEYREETGCEWHEGTEPLFGIPREISHLQDRIFEELSVEESKRWTPRLFAAINEGSDLSMVVTKLMHWLMTDPEGIRNHAPPDGLKEIEAVAALYQRKLAGDEPKREEWINKARMAYAYASTYAYASAYASAASASAYAASAYAYASARQAYFLRIADKLVEILEGTR